MSGQLIPVDLDEENCDDKSLAETVIFDNHLIGNNIPPSYVPAIERGFVEACENGPLIEQNVLGVRMILEVCVFFFFLQFITYLIVFISIFFNPLTFLSPGWCLSRCRF